eukprot:763233-Hanusia_phi.AAC.1
MNSGPLLERTTLRIEADHMPVTFSYVSAVVTIRHGTAGLARLRDILPHTDDSVSQRRTVVFLYSYSGIRIRVGEQRAAARLPGLPGSDIGRNHDPCPGHRIKSAAGRAWHHFISVIVTDITVTSHCRSDPRI